MDKTFSNEKGTKNFAAYFFNLNDLPDVRVKGEEFTGRKTIDDTVIKLNEEEKDNE